MGKNYKHIKSETTVTSAVEEANIIRECLCEEMASWRDGLEEKFSQTQKYEDVSATADELENCEEVDASSLDDGDGDLAVITMLAVSTRKGRSESRQVRAGNAASLYTAAAEVLSGAADGHRAIAEDPDVDEETQASAEDRANVCDEVESACTEAADVMSQLNFPGMY